MKSNGCSAAMVNTKFSTTVGSNRCSAMVGSSRCSTMVGSSRCSTMLSSKIMRRSNAEYLSKYNSSKGEYNGVSEHNRMWW